MLVYGVPLRRTVEHPTGLSFASGDPIRDAGDLPDHEVTIHAFVDGQSAATFALGLGLAADPDRVAVNHESGTRTTNRLVVVARLDQPMRRGPVPESCVDVIEHAKSTIDQDADHSEARRRRARYFAQEQEAERAMAPLRASLADVGVCVEACGLGWLRVTSPSIPSGRSAIVETSPEAPFTVRIAVDDLLKGDEGLGNPARETLRRLRLTPDGSRDVRLLGGMDATGVERALSHLGSAIESATAARAAAERAQLLTTLKVTASRGRFIKAAARGVSAVTRRQRTVLRAGTEEISQEELALWIQVGWIEVVGEGRYAATGAATAALAASRYKGA